MNTLTLDDLINKVKTYSNDTDIIVKAYNYAKDMHANQYRQSGEEYITHPLNVAYILAELHADTDTICAGLLHDTLEDTKATKEEIAHEFNPTIANLVDGVTKISKLNFSSKSEEYYANTSKIINSITEDVRIVIIKLADRLHNMRTLQYKSEFKQKENALETLEIYVPIAYYIGAYRICNELEDLSFKYLYPDIYKRLADKKVIIEEENMALLEEIKYKITRLLNDKNIPNEIKIRTKNIYGIYKRMREGHKLSNIHDLLALKVMVDEVDNCYIALGAIHSLYNPIFSKFKDYIRCPKTNMYRSLHTTLMVDNDKLVQTQIRTFDMDKVNSFGLTVYWEQYGNDARIAMQDDLKGKYQFFDSLIKMKSMFNDNETFVSQVKSELFSGNVYVYTNGQRIELPKGSTIVDLAYRLSKDIGDTAIYAYVKDEMVPLDYKLKNNDRVKIVTDDLSIGPKDELEDTARTSYAKMMIQKNKMDWS